MKAAREKKSLTYKGRQIRFAADQSTETCQARKEWWDIFSVLNQKNMQPGCLHGSVSWASDFGSGHDLMVHEFEPHIGLCADSSKPGACFGFYVSLSLFDPPPLMLSPSVSKIK